jgi:hypothetical protein
MTTFQLRAIVGCHRLPAVRAFAVHRHEPFVDAAHVHTVLNVACRVAAPLTSGSHNGAMWANVVTHESRHCASKELVTFV